MLRSFSCLRPLPSSASQPLRNYGSIGASLRNYAKNGLFRSTISKSNTIQRNCKGFHTGANSTKQSRISWFPGRIVTILTKPPGSLRSYSNKVTETASHIQALKNTPRPKTSEIRKLFSYAKPEKWRIAGAIVLLTASSAVTIAIPLFWGKLVDIITDAAQNDQIVEKLSFLGAVLLGVFVLGGLANFGRVYFMDTAGQRIVRRMRETLFGSVMRQEMAFFDKTKTGELVNRLSTDTYLVGESITHNITDGLKAGATAVGGVGMMFYLSPKLAGVALCIVPAVLIMSKFYGSFIQKLTTQVQDSLASATQVAEERMSHIRTVRAFSQEPKEIGAYKSSMEKLLKLQYKEALAEGCFWGLTDFSGKVILLAVMYSGGMMMSKGQMSMGDLSAFMLYAGYVGMSVGGLTYFYTELNRGLGASVKIFELMDKIPTIPITGDKILEPLRGKVDFSQIDFSYPSRSDVSIFSGLDLSIPSGTSLAVVGPSGSGKSTLASLLLRFYDPIQGRVSLDDEDIRDLNPSWLRRHVGTVSQEPALFSCSVAENISYGADDPSSVTTEQIIDAAKKANAHNFIAEFPSGYDTLVGERGTMLSGGQRQRIAIARAILKDPKILILDEATSALDAESEFLVQDALDKVMVGRTVIIIAHRLSTIRNADRIAVLDQGRVTEIGAYNELLNISSGTFKKLVERQTLSNGQQ